MDKSHVSMERKICVVCAKEYDTNSILLDKRLKPSLERNTITGFGICPADQERADQGFIALVEVDPERSFAGSGSVEVKSADQVMKPQDAYRTGRIIHIKKSTFEKVFNTPSDQEVCFIDIDAFSRLKADYEQATGSKL